MGIGNREKMDSTGWYRWRKETQNPREMLGSVPERAREVAEADEIGRGDGILAHRGLGQGREEGRDADTGRLAVSGGTVQRLASSGLTRYAEDRLKTDGPSG